MYGFFMDGGRAARELVELTNKTMKETSFDELWSDLRDQLVSMLASINDMITLLVKCRQQQLPWTLDEDSAFALEFRQLRTVLFRQLVPMII